MTTLHTLVLRDQTSDVFSPTINNLLIALLTLSIIAIVAATGLMFLRHFRQQREAKFALPSHQTTATTAPNTLSPPTAQRAKRGHRRTISITTVPCHHDLVAPQGGLAAEKDAFLNSPTFAPPRSGLPEIHITFPDEDRDVNEKRHSGRVVVVRVSENGGIGLAPYVEPGEQKTGEGLPPYREFMSLDLEKLGGLREKESVWA
jgi:hypothetical protein